MKKTITLLLTALLILTLGLSSAYAAESTTEPNPDLDALRVQMQVLKDLHDQSQTLNQQVTDQTRINEDLLAQIKASTGSNSIEAIRQVNEANQEIRDNQLKPLMEQSRDLRQQIQTATDRQQKVELQQQLRLVIEQAETLHTQIKTNRESVQDDVEALKSQREAAREALSSVTPVWQEQENLWSQVKTLRERNQGILADLKSEVQTKDYSTALGTVSQVIEIQNQINTILQQILANKQQVASLLEAISL